MSKKQLNSLAVAAGSGCKKSLWYLYHYFTPFIMSLVDRSMFVLDDFAAFEEICYGYVADSSKRYDPNLGDFESMVRHRLLRAEDKYTKRGANKRSKYGTVISLDDVPSGIVDEHRAIQVPDVLADVEGDVVTKEMAALLAKGDRRRMEILKAWIQGYNNVSDLSTLLAQRFGGKSETHRRFITRFREECQRALSTAV